MQCLQCHSKKIATGRILDSRRAKSIFAPDGLRFTALVADHGTPLKSFACLDCGFVWATTSAADLKEYIAKHCDQKIDDQA